MSDSAQITESQTFTWEIENFSKLAEPKDTSYFYSANIDNKFFLRLYPQYEIRHMLNHVVVYLHRGPPYGKEITVNCKIAVIDASGEKQFAEGKYRSNIQSQISFNVSFVKKSKLTLTTKTKVCQQMGVSST